MKKRILSLLLCLVLCLSLTPITVLAETADPVPVKLQGKSIRDYVMKGSQTIAAASTEEERLAALQSAYDTVYLGGKPYYVLHMGGCGDRYDYTCTSTPSNEFYSINLQPSYTDDQGLSVDASDAMFLLSNESVRSYFYDSASNYKFYWSKHPSDGGSLWRKLNGASLSSTVNSSFSSVERSAILKNKQRGRSIMHQQSRAEDRSLTNSRGFPLFCHVVEGIRNKALYCRAAG